MASPADRPVGSVDPTKLHYTLAPPGAGSSGPRPLATVVLPCHNEAGHVVREVERIAHAMDTSGVSYELLVVDDGSTDSSPRLLREVLPRFPQMRLMPLRRNGGAGMARRIATGEARGEIVVWTSADLRYPNERVPELVRYLVEHPECAQVVGARADERGKRRPRRTPGRWLVHRLAELVAGGAIADLHSPMRAFRREVALPYLSLLSSRTASLSAATLTFLTAQHAVDYLPVEYVRRVRPTRARPVRAAFRCVVELAELALWFAPVRTLLPPALVLFLLGVLGAVVDLIRQPLTLAASTVLLLLMGLVLGALALLADLVARTRR